MKLAPSLLLAAAAAIAAPGPLPAQTPTKTPPPSEPTIKSGGDVAAAPGPEGGLGMVDDGRYADSWQAAASLFKKNFPQEQWVTLLKDHRQPLGKLLSRQVTNKQFSPTLAGAPAGQYVTFQYDTSFENKKTAVEKVTAVLDVDGQWRVVGYFVH